MMTHRRHYIATDCCTAESGISTVMVEVFIGAVTREFTEVPNASIIPRTGVSRTFVIFGVQYL